MSAPDAGHLAYDQVVFGRVVKGAKFRMLPNKWMNI